MTWSQLWGRAEAALSGSIPCDTLQPSSILQPERPLQAPKLSHFPPRLDEFIGLCRRSASLTLRLSTAFSKFSLHLPNFSSLTPFTMRSFARFFVPIPGSGACLNSFWIRCLIFRVDPAYLFPEEFACLEPYWTLTWTLNRAVFAN